MLRAGYSKRLAIMSVMSASLPGQLIPPSILLVVYAGVAETPVGPQLLAGIGPGLLVCLLFATIMVAIAVINPRLAGRDSTDESAVAGRLSNRQMWGSLLPTWPVPLLMIIIAGMFTGFFTASEAGAAAALTAVVIGLIQRRRNRPMSCSPRRRSVRSAIRARSSSC